jgi:radical SAM superfamily enzyme YgiQ (UPF0313 family)
MPAQGTNFVVCLIGPPTVTEFEGTVTDRNQAERLSTNHPPLGVLSLAAVLEEKGIPHQLFDLNRLFYEWICNESPGGEGGFFPLAVRALQSVHANVYGFGTISSSYPLTVRLAREVKRAHPDAAIVFGGPQASAVAVETLEAFPFVDVVVRGEAEQTLPELLTALGCANGLAGVAGITFRRNGSVVCTRDSPVLPDLDRLPTPAYHLWPGIEKRRTIPLEVGRGCPFACTFCSTSEFFRRRFRLKTPARVIEQMKALHQTYGTATFNLVHDTFTAVRAQVVEFCHFLLNCGCKFEWTCSARTDCVDEELLALMARAGCRGFFFGIESGSARIQRAIGKCLDLEHASAAIRCTANHRMRATISLITGFPSETADDLRGSVSFIMNALRCDRVQAQFHLLAPLAGTALNREFRGRLKWDGLFSDMAFQGWRQDAADRALILEHPSIFPNFYSVPTAHLDRGHLMELHDFLMYGIEQFRWLMVALDRRSGILAVFDRWRTWRASHRPLVRVDGEYHASAAFRGDFLEFVASEYPAGEDAESLAVTTLLEYETQFERPYQRGTAPPASPPTPEGAPPVADLEAVPRVATGVTLLHLSADYEGVIDCLRSNRPLGDVPRRPVVVADRQLPRGGVEMLQLSALSAALIQLCDGVRTVREIAALFPCLAEGLDRFPAQPACRFALNELVRQGLLVFSPAAA